MCEIHDFLFEKAVEGMTAEEVLNYYRNLYHAEPISTERGIIANALNDILPRMIVPPVRIGQRVWYIKGGYYNSAKKHPCEIEVTEINQKFCGKVLSWGFIANGTRYRFSSIGKTVFLSREEAEQALKGEVTDD